MTSINFTRANSLSFRADTLSDLYAFPVSDIADGMICFLAGQTALDDGLGGIYAWDALTTDPDDGVNVIAPTGLATGRWRRILSNNRLNALVTTPRDFGADTTGATDSRTAFAAATAKGPITITKGSYKIASDITFADAVTFDPGAKIIVPDGVTVTFGSLTAGEAQIFELQGSGKVVLDGDQIAEGWVDWFGTDADAIEAACGSGLRVVRMGPWDYIVDRTVVIDQSYLILKGCRGSAEGFGGTRIVQSASAPINATVIQIGTTNTAPGDIPGNVSRRLHVEGINTVRVNAVNPATTDKREDAAIGWLIAGTYESSVKECFDYNSPIHYRVYGNCATVIDDCHGVRPQAGNSNGHADFYTAICVGGYAPSFGFIGANASVTIKNCGTGGGVGTSGVGLYLFGYIGDTWIEKFECSQLDHGVYVDGSDSGGSPVSPISAHRDVRVENCVLDALAVSGVTVRNINRGGGIMVAQNYVAINNDGNAILIENSTGNVMVSGGDLVGTTGFSSIGLSVSNSSYVNVNGLMTCNFNRGLNLENVQKSHFEMTIQRTVAGSDAAVYASGVFRSYVAPIIDGVAGSWTYGINALGSCTYNEFNLTKVGLSSISTPDAAHKLWYAGATWGGGGTFGTGNVASGVLN